MLVMQEIDFHDAFSLTRQKLTVAEIARKIGSKRQTIKEWEHMVRGPHERNRKLFLDWYRRDVLIQDQRRGIERLLEKYKNHLPSTSFTIEWYDKSKDDEWPNWIDVNLKWFFSSEFYYWNNRRGQQWDDCGWIRRGQDYDDFQRLLSEDRINELIGLSLL
jgi:transcriptional regulator with XRE-family HTH domain